MFGALLQRLEFSAVNRRSAIVGVGAQLRSQRLLYRAHTSSPAFLDHNYTSFSGEKIPSLYQPPYQQQKFQTSICHLFHQASAHHTMTSQEGLQTYLDKASVSPEVFTLCPDYRVLLLAISNIQIGPSNSISEVLLLEAESAARSSLASQPVTEIPHVAAWREAYKAFGAKPNKFRNSLEALTRRVTPSAGLPRVNRLTDIYNAISVKHQIPLGGEDLDKYSGPPRCIRATGKEEFQTTTDGKVVVEHPDAGEVVWVDDAGVTCRRWNWRQGPRTALADETSSTLFIMDALKPCTDEDLGRAADELVEVLKRVNPDIHVARRLIGKGR